MKRFTAGEREECHSSFGIDSQLSLTIGDRNLRLPSFTSPDSTKKLNPPQICQLIANVRSETGRLPLLTSSDSTKKINPNRKLIANRAQIFKLTHRKFVSNKTAS